MSHVKKVRVLLFIFYLLASQLGTFVSSSILLNQDSGSESNTPHFLQSQTAKMAEPRRTVINNAKMVSFSEVPQTAIIEKSDLFSFESLEDSPECDHFTVLNDVERRIIRELLRLGVRIYSSMGVTKIHLKYITSITLEQQFQLNKNTAYDEAHHMFNSMDLNERIPGSIWDILAKGNRGTLLNYLAGAMSTDQLMRACLILAKYPRLIEELPDETFHESVFLKHGVRTVYKYFFFKLNPEFFMHKLMESYRAVDDPTYQKLHLAILSDILVDLKISDECIQRAFNFVLNQEAADLQFPVMDVFVKAKRSNLVICERRLQSILFGGGPDNLNYRLSLLNLNIPSAVLESTVRMAFDPAHRASKIIYAIMANKDVVNRLGPKTIIIFVVICVRLNRPSLLKSAGLRASFDAVFRLKLQPGILFGSIERINLETFQVLINLKLSSNGFPIFSRQHLIQTAAWSIEQNRLDICQFLFSSHFIVAHDVSVHIKKSLLAHAVELDNFKFVRMARHFGINWEKCMDALVVGEISFEMRALLLSYGAREAYLDRLATMIESSAVNSSCTGMEASSPPPSSASPKDPAVFLTPERKFVCNKPEMNGTPLLKRPRTETVVEEYSKYIENGFEMELLEIFCDEQSVETLKQTRGTNSIVWELFERELFAALDKFLSSITEEIEELILEAISKKCDHVIKFFLRAKRIDLTHKIGDRCIMAHLFKQKNVNLAFELMETYEFDVRHSDSPEVNPNGDIILSAAWDYKTVEKLLQKGASADVKFYHESTKGLILLLNWAQLKGLKQLSRVLTKYTIQ